MITESRTILFDVSSIRQAFDWYSLSNNSKIPPLSARNVIILDDADLTVRVSYEAANAATPQAEHFSNAEVAAILISFCRTQNVPVPRAGEKFLAVAPVGLALSIANVITRTLPPPA
jgi:hypothetical protein